MTTLIQRVLIAILISMALSSTGYAANRIHYVINNHLGAPEMLVDENQHVVWQAEYDEFGKATILVEEVEFNHRFPGQYYDKETGLTYNYYRDYDPSLGRYYQSDPIGLAGGINTYGYVGGNPVMDIDPLGLMKWTGGYALGMGGISFKIPSTSGGGIGGEFQLTSDCSNGQKWKVTVTVKGMGVSAGRKK